MTTTEQKYRRVKLMAAGVLGAFALASLAVMVRSFPDMRRYARIERM